MLHYIKISQDLEFQENFSSEFENIKSTKASLMHDLNEGVTCTSTSCNWQGVSTKRKY